MTCKYEELTDGEVLELIFYRFEHHLGYQHFDWGNNPTEMLIDKIDGLFSQIDRHKDLTNELKADLGQRRIKTREILSSLERIENKTDKDKFAIEVYSRELELLNKSAIRINKK